MRRNLEQSGSILLWLITALAANPLLGQPWVAQGPAPTLNGQDEGITGPTNPVSGAINAIAPGSTADLLYVGTVNGGVWKTTNATAASPAWTPLTDQALPATSINSVAISPVDANTIFVGSGSTSSFGSDGNPGFGVGKSTDGGVTWAVLAGATFAGRRINSIVPTSIGSGSTQVVLAATRESSGGVWRSTDGGNSFTRISGSNGLPNAGVTSLVGDPGNPNRFYAGVPGTGVANGIYVSTDAGATWSLTSANILSASRILLSAGRPTGNPVYSMLFSSAGALSGILRSADQGATWVSMGVPPPIFPGGQGSIHGSIAAHPTDPNVVFVAGDRQNNPFPNTNGCNNFSANVFRGVFAVGGSTFTNVVCNGANGTSPHADSRYMAFDANGNLVQANDGGIFRLSIPDSTTRSWSSINGTIQPTEFHSVAYDPLSSVVFGGAQDTGTPVQSAPGSFTWNELLQGDGGNVAVDADQTAHSGTTIRYTSFQFLGSFNRTTWNSINVRLGGFTILGLLITSGPGTGQTLLNFDPNVQFYNPYTLNRINPARMLIGTASIYESMNKGDSLANLGSTGALISSLAYGGRLAGVDVPDVFYVAAGATIRHRVNVGDPITTLAAYTGSTIRGLVMDPNNYKALFVLDNQNRVWMSLDEGASFINITSNLPTLATDVRSIEVYSPTATGRGRVLMVGTGTGVQKMPSPGAAGTSWLPLGTGLPKALVLDLHYDYTQSKLLAGSLGRGAWIASNPFGVSVTGVPSTYEPPAFDVSDAPTPPPPAAPPESQ
jgi:hypothetical protein